MPALSAPPTPNGLPSPTLTNPDMILPASSPSPEPSPPPSRQDQRLPSPSQIGTNGIIRSGSLMEEKRRAKGAMYSPFRNGARRNHDGSVRLRSSSEKGNNRIAFENNRLLYRPGTATPVEASASIDEDVGERIYTESTQGDFENGEGTYTTPAILKEDEDDPHSHAAMTRRAEAILANAKRRLTDMEGNLNRARSTLEERPSSSMSSFDNQSHEPVSLYTLPGKGRRPGGFSPSKHRQPNLPDLNEVHQGHLRVFSETSVPSSMQTNPSNKAPGRDGAETSNGLGMSAADAAFRDRHSEPSRNWFWNGLTRDTSHRHANRHPNGLEALSEDGPALSFEQQEAREKDLEEENEHDSNPSEAIAVFNAQNPPNTSLTRARSTTQMNELREQMQDLKGKISNLKQRARADSMRRRSLQSLRAPSPFTDAEQRYVPSSEELRRVGASPSSLKDLRPPQMVDESSKPRLNDSGHSSLAAEHVKMGEKDDMTPEDEQSEKPVHAERKDKEQHVEINSEIINGFPSQKERLVLVDEPAIVEADTADRELPVDEAASPADSEFREDSLYGDEDYHETSTSPTVERHEDRPDAFDYEHFILSSALGTYSGVGIRRSSSKKKRVSSQSSESSVETTKPRNSTEEVPPIDAQINGGHGRQNSVDSISTTNTFATANEDAESDESQSGWTFGHTRAGSRQADPVKKHKAKASYVAGPDILPANGTHINGVKKHIASAQKGLTNGINQKHSPVQPGVVSPPSNVLNALSMTMPWQEGAPPTALKLGERDLELVERLVKSLAKVCNEVQTLGSKSSLYEARVFRRKLDAARRVLDGEMNGEAF